MAQPVRVRKLYKSRDVISESSVNFEVRFSYDLASSSLRQAITTIAATLAMVVAKKRRQKTSVSTAAISAVSHPAPAVTPRVVPSAAAAKKAAASQAKKAAGGALAGCGSSMSVGGLDGLHPSCVCGVDTAATLGVGHGVSLDSQLRPGSSPGIGPVAPPVPPPVPPPRKAPSASRPSAACQSTLIAQTLQLYGGIVQVITEAAAPYCVLAVSPAWQRLSGFEKHEVVGKPLKMMQATHPNPHPHPHLHPHPHPLPHPSPSPSPSPEPRARASSPADEKPLTVR